MHWCITVQIHSPLAAAERAELQWIASDPDAFGLRAFIKKRDQRDQIDKSLEGRVNHVPMEIKFHDQTHGNQTLNMGYPTLYPHTLIRFTHASQLFNFTLQIFQDQIVGSPATACVIKR